MKKKAKSIPTQHSANICFDCKKACGGCSWSEVDPNTNKIRFEPVPGWTAKKVTCQKYYSGGRTDTYETYQITACPEFERDQKRRSNDLQITDEQFALLLGRWRRLGEII